MVPYILRRLLWLPVILLVVSFVTFVMGRYGPGDPVQVLMGTKYDPAAAERLREQLGLNDNILIQYGRYIGKWFGGISGKVTNTAAGRWPNCFGPRCGCRRN